MRLHIRGSCYLSLVAAFAVVSAASSNVAVCTRPGQFAPAMSLGIGFNPHGPTIADLNADGWPDLAVCVSYLAINGGHGSSLSVLIGHGDGTFEPAASYPLDGAPLEIALGDYNGDGITDIATSNWAGGAIAVLLGNGSGGIGDGTFGPPRIFAIGGHPFTIIARDLDHDGKLDLAVSHNGPGAVTVHHGNGDGTFGAAVSYPLSDLATEMVATDLDHDGQTDLIVAVPYAHVVGLLRGQAGGTFAGAVYFPAGIEPFAPGVADWNNDGILDLMVANGTSGGMQYLKGLGSGGMWNGSFSAPATVMTGNCANAMAADIDGDGRLDVVSALTSSVVDTPVEVAFGDGLGGFSAPSYFPVGLDPSSMAIGDFDNNGKPDVVVGNYLAQDVSVLMGACLAGSNAPAITAVRDVPNDQGGRVFLTWTRSALDVSGGPVTGYRVWRRIPPAMAVARLHRGASAASVIRTMPAGPVATLLDYWEALATLPAQRLAGYGYTAATPQDSMPGSNPYSTFFITAATANIDVFYDSAPDSGYSVDNLAPFAPQGLAATLGGGGATIRWHPNGEGDLTGYRLYRGHDLGFVPSPAALVAALSDTQTVDPQGGPGDVYKLVAVDVHGNASTPTTAGLDLPTAATATALPPVVASDAVTLAWQVDANVPVGIERSVDGLSWSPMATVVRDGEAMVRWTDRGVSAAATYRYRLSIPAAGGVVYAGEIEVRVPGYALALAGVRPNPLVRGPFEVRFTLGSAAAARLDVLDVGGRRVTSLEVGDLGAGSHVIDLDLGRRLPAGLYVIRLSSGGHVLSAKAMVMR